MVPKINFQISKLPKWSISTAVGTLEQCLCLGDGLGTTPLCFHHLQSHLLPDNVKALIHQQICPPHCTGVTYYISTLASIYSTEEFA
jgi:hypothetical protein